MERSDFVRFVCLVACVEPVEGAALRGAGLLVLHLVLEPPLISDAHSLVVEI